MNGGPSQTDTFDLKPGHARARRSRLSPIATRIAGHFDQRTSARVASHSGAIALAVDPFHVDALREKTITPVLATTSVPATCPQGPDSSSPCSGSLVLERYRIARRATCQTTSAFCRRGLFGAAQAPAGFLGPDYCPALGGARERRHGTDGGQLGVENLSLPEGCFRRRKPALGSHLLHRCRKEGILEPAAPVRL